MWYLSGMADGADGPNIEINSLTLDPSGECNFEDPFSMIMTFTTDTLLENYCWKVSWIVDTSKRRTIFEFGSTAVSFYPVGDHEMSFGVERFDLGELPDDVKQQGSGLLSVVLTGPAGDSLMTVNLVTQIYAAPDGTPKRCVINPME